jgi:hypothetical protein
MHDGPDPAPDDTRPEKERPAPLWPLPEEV